MSADPSRRNLALLALLGLALSSNALAADTWNWAAGGCAQTSAGSTVGAVANVGNAWGCGASAAGGSNGATVTGWSTTGYNGTGTNFDKASVRRWNTTGGAEFGIVNDLGESNPDHSVDNNSKLDALLIRFDNAVELNALNIGWKYNDADLTILRYTGGDPSLLGKSTTEIKNDIANGGTGWDLVANVYNLGTSTDSNVPSARFNNANEVGQNKSSSWWLISAFNANLAGTAGDSRADYFKLFSFAGSATSQVPTTGTVPEPASLALALAGLLGLGALRRRRSSR